MSPRPRRLLGAAGAGALLLMAVLAAPAGAAVKVFFPRGEQVLPVQRPGSTAEDAVRALLGGPTPPSAGWASGPTSRGARRSAR